MIDCVLGDPRYDLLYLAMGVACAIHGVVIYHPQGTPMRDILASTIMDVFFWPIGIYMRIVVWRKNTEGHK